MSQVTERERQLAQKCVDCPVCLHARHRQKGLAYSFVKALGGLCPYCRAYEKVYGLKPHEPQAKR